MFNDQYSMFNGEGDRKGEFSMFNEQCSMGEWGGG